MATADALLIIDMQNGVCHYKDQSVPNLKNLIININDRIKTYASEEKPIIFIQHTDEGMQKGSQSWEIIPELDTSHSKYFISKAHPNAFYHTELKEVLDKENVQSLEVCGLETQYCVDATVKFGHGLGFEIQMQKGSNSAWDNDYMTADETTAFYEEIWNNFYVTFIS